MHHNKIPALALCLLLADRMDVAGLSLATAVSVTAAAGVLLIPTVRRYPGVLDRAFWLGLLKMAICTAIMSLVVFLVAALPWLAGLAVIILVIRALVKHRKKAKKAKETVD